MTGDPDVRRTPEERLKAVLRRDDINEGTRVVARRALKRRQEGLLGNGTDRSPAAPDTTAASESAACCPSCGEGVDAGDAFCRHCGSELAGGADA